MPEYDLHARARRAVIEAGFTPDFPEAALRELDGVNAGSDNSERTDLRHLLWSSIDNERSRDLDQLEFAERIDEGDVRLLIAIADVDSAVPKGSALDQHAGRNTVSVYTGVETFPMLPERLSSDLTSLAPDQDRSAVVVEIRVDESGEALSSNVFGALIRSRAKLNYDMVGDWLEHRSDLPPAIRQVPGLEEQVRIQFEAARRLRKFRQREGALTFAECEASPVMTDGEVKELTLPRQNCAREMIESFMVAANVAVARHLKAKRIPAIRRVVRTPKRWDRIREIGREYGHSLPVEPEPEALSGFLAARKAENPAEFPDLSLAIVKLLGPGEYVVEPPGEEEIPHFGLAVSDYTHSTAPNRRYADLIIQRLVRMGKPVYEAGELEMIAARCTERSRAARKVERLMRKVIAAVLLRNRIGEIFNGLITGVKTKGTYVRLKDFPAEGRIVRREQGVDVGDHVRVRLLGVDCDNGFIDFERL